MDNLQNLIDQEEERLKKSASPTDKLNVLYNLIILKNSNGNKNDNYKNIKILIDSYIELIKMSDYGYDSINYPKLNKVIAYINYDEQYSVMKYAISALSRELPEHSKEWFIIKMNQAEIKWIFYNKDWIRYPKAIFLFAGMNVKGLLIVLLSFFCINYLILLPTPISSFQIFQITYVNYSSNFYLNHLYNLISLFSDLKNDFKVIPINGIGLIIMVLGKIVFVLLIVNFIYRKISDKISIK